VEDIVPLVALEAGVAEEWENYDKSGFEINDRLFWLAVAIMA